MKTGPQFGTVFHGWWLVLVGAALGAGAALIAVRATPPVYRATSTLLVIPPSDASLNQSFTRTYAQMAVHPVVLQRVRELVALPAASSPLETMISAHPVPDTQLIELVVQANEPALARDIANASAEAFIEQQASQLPTGPSGPSLRIGQPAFTPDQPIGVRPLPAIALGLLLGALLALGLAVLLVRPKPVPAPRIRMPARESAIVPVAALPPSPTVHEPIGTSDVLRGVLVVTIALGALWAPLAATGGMRSAPSGSGPQQPGLVKPDPSLGSEVAAAPRATQAVPRVPTITDVPLGTAAPTPAGQQAPASGEAEIAGATSAAAPDRPTAGEGAAEPPAPPSASVAPPSASVAPPSAAVAPPAVTPVGAGARAPFFQASFDGSQPAWPNDAAGPARFQDGAYRIASQTPGRFVGITAPFAQPLRDVVVTAVFQKVGGPSGGMHGVILRDGGPGRRDGSNQIGDFYVLGVDDRSQYGVWRHEGDRWVELVPLTPSDAVRGGTEVNQIIARAIDDRLSLTVNNVEVATVLGAQARAGSVGIFVGGDVNEVLVTRFEIEPGTVAAETPSPLSPVAATAPLPTPEVAGAVEARQPETRSATTRAPAGFTSAFLREGPATSWRALASLQNGSPIEILPETASGDGFTWLRARTPDGVLGWIVSTAVAV